MLEKRDFEIYDVTHAGEIIVTILKDIHNYKIKLIIALNYVWKKKWNEMDQESASEIKMKRKAADLTISSFIRQVMSICLCCIFCRKNDDSEMSVSDGLIDKNLLVIILLLVVWRNSFILLATVHRTLYSVESTLPK